MNKNIFSFLFSTRLMAVLFILMIVSMAAGTFIEDSYNTETARNIIYNAWWFEVIMVFFVINFIGNIKKYQLYKREKWSILLIHLSFILIITGAFVTRYISFEGMMLIREGASEKIMYSDKPYLVGFVDGMHQGEMKRRGIEYGGYFAPEIYNNSFLNLFFSNDFKIKGSFSDIPYEIVYDEFLMNVSETIEEAPEGKLFIKMVESGDGSRHEHFLQEGQVQDIHNILYAFNNKTQGAINIIAKNDSLFIESPFEGNYMRMADKQTGVVEKDSLQVLNLRSLYQLAGTQIVFPERPIKGKITYKSNMDYSDKKTDDALSVVIKSQGKEEKLTLIGSKGRQGVPQTVKIGELDFTLFYGSKVYELPFSIKLDDFIADKYPGTEKSYSAFKSKIEIQDVQDNKIFKDSVFMNNILDYKGYRFFQAGFDPDEKGTHLSVNHDALGTGITYAGYFLLYLSLMLILFDKNSRFGNLKKKIQKINYKKAALGLLLFAFFGNNVYSQEVTHFKSKEEILAHIQKYKVSKEHSEEFGNIVIQDYGGRMKPINTFSSELLRKLSKKDTYEGLNSEQAFISMTQFPQYWYQLPIIYLKRGNDSIRNVIGVDKEAKYVPLVAFFDEKGAYKLSKYLDDAYQAKVPNAFQKDFIEADKKVNLFYSALSGQILRVYPIPEKDEDKWISFLETEEYKGTVLDSVKNILPFYLDAVTKSSQTGDYTLPSSLLIGLKKYQQKYGANVMPSDSKIDYEVMYNKYDIFKRLFSLYMLGGILMLFLSIFDLFYDSKWLRISISVCQVVLTFFFILHTLGLIARWYISGHAPWSDAYESMIYVGWATMFFSLALGMRSKIALAAGAFVSSIILMIAHWNWMDPSIMNLQPVLNSYWLKIHVAVIVASYGPFALGMILGVVSLFLMISTSKSNKVKMKLVIDELSYLNEMALTIGLVMLTIGNFLGGQWANESWGRYWGWDPKETWALISILVYAFVIHARLVPGLRGKWMFNVMSVMAFYSILMTYFGVNFYLKGMHSYASGEKVVTPSFVYVSLLLVLILSAVSYIFYKKHFVKNK